MRLLVTGAAGFIGSTYVRVALESRPDAQIVVLDKGRISQQGTPLELYNRPANKFVASFIGSPAMNFFKADVKGQQGKDIELTLPGGKTATIASRSGAVPSGGVEIGVRPEHVKLGPAGNGSAFDGKVRIVEGQIKALGPISRAHVTLDEENQGYTLACRVAPQTPVNLEVAGKLSKPFSKGRAESATASPSIQQQ